MVLPLLSIRGVHDPFSWVGNDLNYMSKRLDPFCHAMNDTRKSENSLYHLCSLALGLFFHIFTQL